MFGSNILNWNAISALKQSKIQEVLFVRCSLFRNRMTQVSFQLIITIFGETEKSRPWKP